MKIIKDTLTNFQTTIFTDHFFTEDTFLFDIETTGFSTKYNTIYLIGAAYHSEQGISTIQFFAETPDEEADLLTEFMQFISDYTTTITFNGLAFDLPFIEKRCAALNIPCTLSEKKHLDLFKEIKRCSKFLQLESYKQKSIEEFLDIYREDKYNGGELIEVYHVYCFEPSADALQLLLLHNIEDVTGMFDLTQMFAYPALLDGHFHLSSQKRNHYRTLDQQEQEEMLFTFDLLFPIPVPVFFKNDHFSFKLSGNTFTLAIPLWSGTLKYYFADYKNYYYLPEEDRAYHKSVSAFIPATRRQKAKATTCYQKKQSSFLYQPQKIFSPAFQMEYQTSDYYFEYTDATGGLTEVQIIQYASSLLSNL